MEKEGTVYNNLVHRIEVAQAVAAEFFREGKKEHLALCRMRISDLRSQLEKEMNLEVK